MEAHLGPALLRDLQRGLVRREEDGLPSPSLAIRTAWSRSKFWVGLPIDPLSYEKDLLRVFAEAPNISWK